VEEIAISKFKATCLAVLGRVSKTRKPLLITRFGKPVALVSAPPPPQREEGWLGSLAGTGRIDGDIVSPASSGQDWEVLRE
jgi:hypothetical protein